jgi:hypothetical protein
MQPLVVSYLRGVTMFITAKNRKYLILVMGLMLLVGIAETTIAETTKASCSIAEVCKYVEKGKKGSTLNTMMGSVEEKCGGMDPGISCPPDQVTDYCWNEAEDIATKCK